jgi:hypothetical protein
MLDAGITKAALPELLPSVVASKQHIVLSEWLPIRPPRGIQPKVRVVKLMHDKLRYRSTGDSFHQLDGKSVPILLKQVPFQAALD